MTGDNMAQRMSDQIEASQAIADEVLMYELLWAARAEIRCLYRQSTNKDPREARGSVGRVLKRLGDEIDRMRERTKA